MGKIKKIIENELVGGTQSTDIYPVTSVKAVYDENNERLDNILSRRGVVNVSTNYNTDHIAEVLTLAQAIAKVPSSDRVLGFTMTFLSSVGWMTYQFTGDSIATWTTTSEWEILNSNNITSDLGESKNVSMSQYGATFPVLEQVGSAIEGKFNKSFTTQPGIVQVLGYPMIKGRRYSIHINLESITPFHIRVLRADGSEDTIISSDSDKYINNNFILEVESGLLGIYTSVASEVKTANITIEDLDDNIVDTLGQGKNAISQKLLTDTILAMNGISGSGLSWEETITPGSEGKITYGLLKKGTAYRISVTYKETGEMIPINVRGINREGSHIMLKYINNIIIVDKDIYGILIYYGSQSNSGSTAVVKINREDVYLSNEYSNPNNVLLAFNTIPLSYSDSRVYIMYSISTEDTSVLPFSPNRECIKYRNGKAYVQPHCCWMAFLDMDAFGLEDTTDGENMLQAIVQANIDNNTQYISFDIDSSEPKIYNQVHRFSQFKEGVYIRVQKLNSTSLSRKLRFMIDNRLSDTELEIGFVYVWKEKATTHTTSGLLSALINKLNYGISKMPILNLCPKLEDFNLKTGYVEITGKKSFKFTSTIDMSVFGFNLLRTPDEKDFTVYFEVGNIDLGEGDNMLFYIIYYDQDNTEISRSSLSYSSSGLYRLMSCMPALTHHIIVRFQSIVTGQEVEVKNIFILQGRENYLVDDLFYNTNIVSGVKQIRVGINENVEDVAKLPLVYVDGVNGNDNNDGTTLSTALRTFSKAFSLIADDATIMLKGDADQRFNIKANPTQKSLRLIGISGKLNRILGGTKITSGTLIEGNVYSATVNSFSSAERFQIFQHNAIEENTLISSEDRHPCQRGKSYRCESSKLIRKASLEEVKTSDELSFYYDTENKLLYFKIKEGTNLTNNPIYIPGSANVYGNDGTVKFEMSGIESWYGAISVTKCHGGKIIDCAAKYAYGGGAFDFSNSIGIELIRCEAARAFSGSTTGDGFNAHSGTGSSINETSKRTTATMIDCWSHDNNDDGYSDHEGCEVTIIGGLFENNVKGGLTPSFGAHDKYIGCHVRNNTNGGIYYVGTAVDGGVGGQAECINCISENNSWNYGVANGTEEQPNKLILVNCISINGDEGFKPFSSYNFIDMVNCYDRGSTIVKSGKTANITIKNASIIE